MLEVDAGPAMSTCTHGVSFANVFKNKPAPDNLDIPPYMFTSGTSLVIGKDEKGEA